MDHSKVWKKSAVTTVYQTHRLRMGANPDAASMEELTKRFELFEQRQAAMAQENERLREQARKAEQYMGKELPELKSVRYHGPKLSDSDVEVMSRDVKEKPDLKEQKAIKDSIITAMSTDLSNRFKGHAHKTGSSWMKFSRIVLDKVREYSHIHVILLLGDTRMDEWITENAEKHSQLQYCYYHIVADLCTESVKSAIDALGIWDNPNCATLLFRELSKIAKDDTAEALRKHWEMGELKFDPKRLSCRDFIAKVLRLNDEVREADPCIAWGKPAMAKFIISTLPTTSMEWVAEKNAVERDMKSFDAEDDEMLHFVVDHILRCSVASQTHEKSHLGYPRGRLQKNETVGKNHGGKVPVCSGCGRTGHTKQECKACWNCGRWGHTARKCTEPQKSKEDKEVEAKSAMKVKKGKPAEKKPKRSKNAKKKEETESESSSEPSSSSASEKKSSSKKKKEKAQSLKKQGMNLYSMKLVNQTEMDLTVTWDDECGTHESSCYKSENLEEHEVEHFKEYAINEYEVLELQGPVRGKPALDSADGAGVTVSENDSKLELALESQGDEAATETQPRNLDVEVIDCVLGSQGIDVCQPALDSAQEAGVRMSATDSKLELALESQGDEAATTTLQTKHGVLEPLGKGHETDKASELQAQLEKGDDRVISACAALRTQLSENDVKLHVQPKESHGEVVDISCTEGAEYDYGHILDRSVAPKTALDATSSASDVKLETLPALQHDEECGGFQLQVGFPIEEENPGLRPLRLVKVKTSDQSDKEQALVDSGADASIFRSSDEVHDLEPASLRLEVGNGEYVDCPGVGNVKALVTVYKNGRRSGTAHLKIRAYWSQDVPHGTRILSVLDLCKQGMTVVFPTRDDKLGHRIVLADGRYIKVKDMEITAIFEKSGVVGIEEKLMSSHMGRVDRFHRCMSASDILRQKIITAHVRFGHLGGEMLRKLLARLDILATRQQVHDAIGTCESCALVKTTAESRSKTPGVRPKEPLHTVSLDFYLNMEALGGPLAVVATDRCSSFVMGKVIKKKSDVLQLVEDINRLAVARSAENIRRLHSDNEAVLRAEYFRRWCEKHGVQRTHSPSYQQHRNGDVESEIKQISHLQSLLHLQPNIKRHHVLHTWKHALLLRNTNPRKRLDGLTAWEKFYADQPDKAALLVEIHAKMLPLGTKVVYYRPQQRKTGYRGERGIIVGLCLHTSPVSYIVETEKGTIIEVAKVIVTSTLPLHLIEEGLQDAPGLSNEGESEDENDDKDEDDGHSQTSYEEMSENDVKLDKETWVDTRSDEPQRQDSEPQESLESDPDVQNSEVLDLVRHFADTAQHEAGDVFDAETEYGTDDEIKQLADKEADKASEESFDTTKARDDSVQVARLNALKQKLESQYKRLADAKHLVKLRLHMDPHDRVKGVLKSLKELTTRYPRLQMNSILDKTELLLLAEQGDWRLENIADGMGIDANQAFGHISGEIHRLDKRTKHEIKRAIAKELIEFITTGTIRRCHPPKLGREVSPPPIEFATLVTRKTNAQGEVEKYKSRMVLRGDKEKEGLHFRLEDVRTIGVDTVVQRLYELTSITKGCKPVHKDVRAAYLNTTKVQEAFVWAPIGIIGLKPGECAALGTEVYGSRTAAKAWSDRSSAVHLSAGMVPISEYAPHLCKKVDEKGNMVISLTYVDNYRFSCSRGKQAEKMLEDVIGRIGAVLPLTDEDPEEWLGQKQEYMRVDNGWIMRRSMPAYIEKLFEDYKSYGLEQMRFQKLPVRTDICQLLYQIDKDEPQPTVPYRELVGALLWYTTNVGVGGAHAWNLLSRYVARWYNLNWDCALKLLKYFYDHRFKSIEMHPGNFESSDLVVYTDSSHNDELQTGATTIMWIVFHDGNCINYKVQRKVRPVDPTSEDEVRGMYEGYIQSLSYRHFAEKLGWKFKNPTAILGDNEPILKALVSPTITERTRHLKIKYLALRHARANGIIRLGKVSSANNVADIGTKAVFTQQQHERLVNMIVQGRHEITVDKWY